jgi:predicted amidohydrolase
MPRNVNVVVTALQRKKNASVSANRELVTGLLEQACAEKPDIVCLPENFPTVGVGGEIRELAEPVPGPTTDEVAKRARQYRTYVVCPLFRREKDLIFNSAVILDRQGQVVGIYDKMHNPNRSWGALKNDRPYELNCNAGTEAAVCQLDFGKVGVQICFDLEFSTGWRQLAEHGAELVFWPSAFDGGFHLRMRAFEHHYFVASSVLADHARIINPLAEVLATTGPWRALVAQTVDLDYVVCYFDFYQKKLAEMKAKYGPDLVVRVLEEEGYFMLQSRNPDLPLAEMRRKFSLVSAKTYFERHAAPLARSRKRPE